MAENNHHNVTIDQVKTDSLRFSTSFKVYLVAFETTQKTKLIQCSFLKMLSQKRLYTYNGVKGLLAIS